MEVVSNDFVVLLFRVWYELRYEIDIPNIKNVSLPNSFEYVKSKSINRIRINEWIVMNRYIEYFKWFDFIH